MHGFTIFNNDYYLHLIARARLAKRFALSHIECRSNVLAHRDSRGPPAGRRHVARCGDLQAPSLQTSDARVTRGDQAMIRGRFRANRLEAEDERMTDLMTIADGELSASVAVRGAELFALRYRERDYLWHGDPTWWASRAPMLFPVVGKSPDGKIRIDGKPYPMPPHGFVRERGLKIAEREARRICLELTDDPSTRAMYPFAFNLRIEFDVREDRLEIVSTVRNTGPAPMPFGLGYHPAFLWPVEPERRRTYICVFEKPEPAPILRSDLATGLLRRERFPSPVAGKTLRLADSQFEEGAMQFDAVRSRRVWFGPAGAGGIDVRFPDSPQLGIWTKPGAPYLCIEPWQGLAEHEGASGELRDRPGTRILDPGASAGFRLVVRPGVRNEIPD